MLDLVSRLVDKSLIVFDDNVGRYRLLETILQFARERLVEAEEMAATRACSSGLLPGLRRAG